jgi:hypothetical protein
MVNLSALKALQARIRQATGPDRELDGRIGFVFGLGYSKNYRECECCESHVIGKDGSKLTYSSLAYWQTFPQWTGSLDACVALMMEVLPGFWTRRTDGSFQIWPVAYSTFLLSKPLVEQRPLANDCLTFIDAIIQAEVAKLEAPHVGAE